METKDKPETMGPATWSAVDNYIVEALVPQDEALEEALSSSTTAGLPSIQVSASQGKFLHLMAKAVQAKAILEIGTLGGYSTLWLARGMVPGGKLITLELEKKHAEVALANFRNAKLDGAIELRHGPAMESLKDLVAAKAGPFDLIFIDADKEQISDYFLLALELSRKGTMIISDNVVRNGGLIQQASGDAKIEGVRKLHELISKESRVTATTVQTVGGKGYDGFMMALVT
jgi:predicted O-methyltransferase YrrM